MPCPQGYHQHTGADGQRMLACHPINEKHSNPATQQAHEAALNAPAPSRDARQTQRISAKPSNDRPSEERKPAKQPASNVAGKVFGSSTIEEKKNEYRMRFKRAAKSKNIPLRAVMFAASQIARIYDAYQNIKDRKAVENTMQGYVVGWQKLDKVISQSEETDALRGSSMAPAYALRKRAMKLYDEAKANPNANKKNTVEYGELKVYSDYLKYLTAMIERKESVAQRLKDLSTE